MFHLFYFLSFRFYYSKKIMSEKVVTIAMNADYPFGVSREH